MLVPPLNDALSSSAQHGHRGRCPSRTSLVAILEGRRPRRPQVQMLRRIEIERIGFTAGGAAGPPINPTLRSWRGTDLGAHGLPLERCFLPIRNNRHRPVSPEASRGQGLRPSRSLHAQSRGTPLLLRRKLVSLHFRLELALCVCTIAKRLLL
jgi:hypothetical protein